MSDDGHAVIIAFPGILYRGNAESKIRAWMLENGYIHRIQSIPAKTFADTAIATVALLLRKQPAMSVIFINEHGAQITATLDDIRQNGYNLSPAQYFPEEEKTAPSMDDIRANDEQVKELFYRNFKTTLTGDIWIQRVVQQQSIASVCAYLHRFRALIDQLMRQVKCGVPE